MFSWIIGIPLLTLFAAAGLTIAVVPSTRHEPSRSSLNVLLVLIALWTFCSVMIHSIAFPSSLFWMYLILLCGISTGVVGVHFSAQFTKQTGRTIHLIVSIFYILIFVIFILLLFGHVVEEARLLPNGAVEVKFGTMAYLMWGMAGIATLVTLAILISAYIKSPHYERKYLIFPVLGFIVMCFGALSNIIFSSYPVDIAANLIFISLLTYGVVGRHLLTQASKQPRLLSISVIALILALCYTAVFIFCLKWLGITTIASHLIAAIAVIVFGSITFGPSRMFLSNKLALRLFPSIYRYQKALNDLVRVDMSLTHWPDSVINSLNIIAKATRADSAVLLLRNIKEKCFESKYVVGHDTASLLQLTLPSNSPLVKALVERGATLSSQDIGGQIASTVLLRGKDDTLREIDPTLYYGIQSYKGLSAIIALMRKSPHEWDRTEDRDFLELAGRQITPIIINADLYMESQLEIEARKQIEKALRQSEDKYRSLVETAGAGVASFDTQGNLTFINTEFCEMTGYAKEELVGTPFINYIHPDDRETLQHIFLTAFEKRRLKLSLEFRAVHKNSHYIWLYSSPTPLIVAGNLIGFMAIVTNITERKNMESELLASRDQLRNLATRLQITREDERKKIAIEIHDDLGQSLTALQIDLSWLAKQMPHDQKKLLEKAESMLKLVKYTDERVRLIATELRPPLLDDIGFILEAQSYLGEFEQRTGISCDFSSQLREIALDTEISMVLYRMLQGSLTNIAKHAGATQVNVRLENQEDGLFMVISDNGRGITQKELTSNKSIGIIGMRERIASIGGSLQIEGTPGKGTTVKVKIPLQKDIFQ